MRTTYSSICSKHGYHLGADCPKCEGEDFRESFMTSKDQLYNFYSSALDMRIESKTQWKRELKKRGLTDDFNQSFKDREREIRNYKPPDKKIPREEIKNRIREEMKSKGIYDRKKLFLDKPKQIWIGE